MKLNIHIFTLVTLLTASCNSGKETLLNVVNLSYQQGKYLPCPHRSSLSEVNVMGSSAVPLAIRVAPDAPLLYPR